MKLVYSIYVYAVAGIQRRIVMECKEVQNIIPKYIDGSISDEELEEFLLHIANCKECYEELEITYTIKEALQQLDDNPEVSFNIGSMLKKDICLAKKYIRRKKKLHSVLSGIYVTTELALILVTIIQLCVWFTGNLWVF